MKPETTGTPLETKLIKLENGAFRPVIHVKYKGEFLQLEDILKLPELKGNELTYGKLYRRCVIKPVNTLEEFLMKGRYKKRKPAVKRVIHPQFSIIDHGKHKEKKEGEVFAGFITMNNFDNGNFWEFQRIGKPVKRKYESPNHPWFLLESEIWAKDWVIVRDNK